MIRILDICSGIGGFSLGLESTGGFDTVAFCEFDDFCCKVLNKHWPDVPIYKDLKEIGNEPERIIQDFDLICGGIPCQPFSVAGKKKGKEDDRHLWPYMYEIIKHKKPSWVIVENVGGFVNVALDDVCLDLEAQGYATQSFVIPACSVEAPHRRDRVWILGKNLENPRRALRQGGIEQGENADEVGQGDADQLERSSSTPRSDVANASIEGLEGRISGDDQGRQKWQALSRSEEQQDEVGADTRCSSGLSTKEDVANTERLGQQGQGEHERPSNTTKASEGQASGTDDGSQGQTGQGHTEPGVGGMDDGVSARLDGHFGFTVEPNIPRVATGIPERVNRLKALGNSIVPQVIRNIGLAILEEEERTNDAD